MRHAVVALAWLLAASAFQPPSLVGWRFQLLADPSRTYEPEAADLAGAGARPLAITMFYPATSKTRPSTYEEFATLGAYATFREPPAGAFEQARATVMKAVAPDALGRTSRSVRDAAPAPGTYPLVLFAHGSPLGMVAMSEDLAAHGFVVAGVLSRGAERGPYRLSVPDVQAMGDDLRVALDHLDTLSMADTSRVGVIGMSNGAFGAVALANTTRVQAMVSLDGTVGERAAARVLPALRGASSPVSVPPLLHLFAPENSYLDFSELRQRPGACFTVRVPELPHTHFLTFALLRPVAPAPAANRVAERFAAVIRLTREFLTAHLVSRSPGPVRLARSETNLGLRVAACRDR